MCKSWFVMEYDMSCCLHIGVTAFLGIVRFPVQAKTWRFLTRVRFVLEQERRCDACAEVHEEESELADTDANNIGI